MSLDLPRGLLDPIKRFFREWHDSIGHQYPHNGTVGPQGEQGEPGADGGGGGASAFLDLTDVDETTFVGEALKTVRVNAGETALEFGAAAATDEIVDADADTKVQVEESADEDKIRMDTAGTERVVVQNSTPHVAVTGDVRVSQSLFLADQAADQADAAGYGQLSVDNNTPDQLRFTDDAGNVYKLGNQFISIPLTDTVVHASDIKGASSYKGGPASQTTANWVAQAWCITAIPGGGTTCSIEVHRIRSGVDTTVATVTITASNTRGSASSAFTVQNDDIIYLLHTGGTSGDGDLIGVDIYRQ